MTRPRQHAANPAVLEDEAAGRDRGASYITCGQEMARLRVISAIGLWAVPRLGLLFSTILKIARHRMHCSEVMFKVQSLSQTGFGFSRTIVSETVLVGLGI